MFKSIFKAIFLFLIVACSSDSSCHRPVKEWLEQNGRIKILATTAQIGDLVKKIAGDEGDVHVLIQGSLDPHSYQLVKGDEELLSFADIVIYNGLNLEHGPGLQKKLKEQKNALALGDELKKMDRDAIIVVQGQPDPHIWMDVELWSRNVEPIVDALIRARPEYEDLFRKRGTVLKKQLLVLDEKIKALLNTIPEEKRYLVTSHDAFNYFAKRYLATNEEKIKGDWQKRFQAPEGLSPESQLSTSDIQGIIDHLMRYKVPVVFPESNVNEDSIRKIVQAGQAKGVNVKIAKIPLYADAMGCPGSGAETYETMIYYNAKTIADYLTQMESN